MNNIIYLLTSLENKSPNNVLYNIISNIHEKEKIFIVTLSCEKSETLYPKFKNLGVNLISLNLGFINSLFLSYKKLDSIIKEIDPHIIQSQGFRPDLILSLINKNGRFKKITLIHNIFKHDYIMTYGFLLGNFMTFINFRILNRFDFIIGVSNSIIRSLKKASLQKKLLSIQNGVDSSCFFEIPISKKKIKRIELGLPVDKKIWIVVGTLSKRKNPIHIIKTFQMFNKDHSNILLFLGDGELMNTMKIEKKDDESIYLIGNVKNVSDYLKCSNYFISASKSEGLPMAVLESLSCGVPVLLSDIPSHKEVFSTNPKIGYLFELDNELDFLLGFNILSNSDLSQISNECRSLIDSNFTSKIMAEKYLNFYNELIL